MMDVLHTYKEVTRAKHLTLPYHIFLYQPCHLSNPALHADGYFQAVDIAYIIHYLLPAAAELTDLSCRQNSELRK